MSTNVLLIDESKFTASINAKITEYKGLANVAQAKGNEFELVMYGAVALAIKEVGQTVIDTAITEKWD